MIDVALSAIALYLACGVAFTIFAVSQMQEWLKKEVFEDESRPPIHRAIAATIATLVCVIMWPRLINWKKLWEDLL